MKKFVALLMCLTLGFAIGCGGQAKTPAKPTEQKSTEQKSAEQKSADQKPAEEKPAAPGKTE